MRFKRRRAGITADLDAGEAGLLAALAEDLLGLLRSGARAEVVFETMLERRDGSSYPAELCIQLMTQEEPPLFVAMVHDTSDRRRLTLVSSQA